jgi:hypothetical protein
MRKKYKPVVMISENKQSVQRTGLFDMPQQTTGLTFACFTCGAVAGEDCELNTGGLRTTSHLDRRWAELEVKASGKQKSRAASAGGQNSG